VESVGENKLSTKNGYLGTKGTFTKLAVDTAFNGENKVAYKTIPQSIDAVINEEVDLVVVPIENAIEGTVHLTIDYLVHQKRLPICADLVVTIKQNLLINSNFIGELKNITGVYSHTQAIAQTQQYIHNELPNASIEYTDSTGSAAELVSKSSEPIAAIGNVLAAKEYRSEEHTSELQSRFDLVCRLLLERPAQHRDIHSFPTRRSSDLKNITGVYSHTQAIAQTQQYIHNELPNASIEYTDSTGSAAELVSKSSEPIAAIGNVLAAKEY